VVDNKNLEAGYRFLADGSYRLAASAVGSYLQELGVAGEAGSLGLEATCRLATALIELGDYYSNTESYRAGEEWYRKADDTLRSALKAYTDSLSLTNLSGWLEYQRGYYSDAIASFATVIDAPAAPIAEKKFAFRWKTSCLLEMGRVTEAEGVVTAAEKELGVGTPEVVIARGWLRFQSQRYEQALKLFQLAVGGSTPDEGALLGKFCSLLLLTQQDAAGALARELMSTLSGDRAIKILFGAGWKLYGHNEHEASLSAFTLITELDSKRDYPCAHEMRADTLKRMHRYEGAQHCCEEALKLFPGNAGLINELGFVLYYQRDYQEALDKFSRPEVKDSPFAEQYRTATLREMNRYKDADECVTVALSSLPGDPDLLNEKAQILLDRCRYDEAIKVCRQVLDENRDDEDANETLVACYREMGDLNEAERLADEALKRLPHCQGLWEERAQIYYDRGELEAALNPLSTAIGIDSYVLHNRFMRAEILSRLNRSRDAILVFEELERQFADDVEVKERYGGLFTARHEPYKAKVKFQDILDRHPGNPYALNGMGGVYLEERNWSAAAGNFSKAIDLAKYEPQFHVNLAFALLKQADRSPDHNDQLLGEAEHHCREALGLFGRNARAYQCLGLISYERGSYLEAEEYFIVSSKMDSTDGSYLNLAALYSEMARYDEAKKQLDLVRKYDPYEGRVYIELAHLSFCKGAIGEALDLCRTAAMLDPHNDETYWALAISLMRADQYSEAERVLRGAIGRLDEVRRPRLLRLLSRVLVRFGDDEGKDQTRYDDALQQINSSIRIDSSDPEAYFCKGVILFKLEQYRSARASFEQCLRLDTNRFDATRNIQIVNARRKQERLQSMLTRWGPWILFVLSLAGVLYLWIAFFLGWNAVDKSMLTFATPLLLGTAVIALLLPYLSKLKLPGGFEADISDLKRYELSMGPKGEIGFGSSLPTISSLLSKKGL
jgi:tetratricopeptide (TPR) repeat protein